MAPRHASLARALLATALAVFPTGAAPAEDGMAGLSVSAVLAVPRCLAERVTASGTFVASREVEIRADREGLVVGDVLVEPGDVVTKGQVLGRLVSATGTAAETVPVRAPVDGTVLAVGTTVGAYVSPKEGDPLFRIAEGGQLELKAQVLPTSLRQLHPNQAARLHVVGLGDLDGHLVAIEDGVDPQTQLGILHLGVDANPKLRAGLFARAEIDIGQQCGLAVPLSALLYGREGAVVGIVQENRVVMRAVTTGLLQGNSIAIRDGLSENDVVIARAGTFLREGDHVRAVEMPADGPAERLAGDRPPGWP